MDKFDKFTQHQLHAVIAGLDSVILTGMAEKARQSLLKQARHVLRVQHGLVVSEEGSQNWRGG